MLYTRGRQTASSSLCFAAVVLLASIVSLGECQVTPSPSAPCSAYKNCDTCAPNAKCLWCFESNNCTDYPVSWLLPPASLCPLSQARWGVCWMNFEAFIITLGVIGGVILISIISCCCCCCFCRKRRSDARRDRDEERFARRREEAKQRSEERREERKARHDEIRKKYGLIGDSDHPYSKFENE